MKQPEYKDRIDAWVDAHTDQMLEDVKKLIRIPSVKGEAKDGMPYGEMPAKAVLLMQEMMEQYGFRTVNYENHCVAADMDGAGDKALDILTHLDVVPVTDTWTKTAPFEPLIEGDRIYGRGSSDDKGPAVAALYAMRCVRELGLPLKKGVRLICGSDEENGSDDLAYYYGREEEAPYTFSPDADYPLINIEKGRLQKSFRARGSEAVNSAPGSGIRVLHILAGDAANIVPGRGKLVLRGAEEEILAACAKETQKVTGGSFSWEKLGEETVVLAQGEAAHAASPETGIDSAVMILELLKRLPLEDAGGEHMLLETGRLFPNGMVHGEGFGVSCSDEESGELTMALTVLKYDLSQEQGAWCLEGTFDCRAPLCCNDRNLTDPVTCLLRSSGFEPEEGEMVPGHRVSADSELVRKLLESYALYFGKEGKPFAIGGGTYVHGLERGVAFGCAVPEVDNRMHGDDEFMEVSMLVRSTKIFADAILRLCGGES